MHLRLRLLLSAFVLVISLLCVAQQPGPNVNVLPSYPNGNFAPPFPPAIMTNTDPLRGDGYLQRQAEPALATSTYNPDHVLAAFGDYRTVSLASDAGLPGAAAEGWIGLSRSYDRGHTWFGSMVPGFPQDTSAVGQASPLYGQAAGADPVMATTPGGHFYIGGLFFTRGGLSNVAVIHYRDVPDLDGGDTIRYLGAFIVDKGSKSDQGNFIDKPGMAADIARGTTDPSVCGPVYIAYTIFTGGGGTIPFTSKLGFSRSKQGKCGVAWDPPQYLNKNYKQNQGAAAAVDPNTGKVYVVWRHVFVPGGDGFPDGILMATSTDSGATFSPPVMIATIAAFDHPSITTAQDPAHPTFRSNAFPTIAIDGNSKVYVAIQEKTFPTGGNYPPGYYEPRVVIRTSSNGGKTWTNGSIVDVGPGSAQQFMPALSFASGLLKLMWYDFRDQNMPSDAINGGFYVSGYDRQVKTYVAQSNLANVDANGNPVFAPSVPVTMYLTDPRSPNQAVINVPGTSISAVNRPNLTMYSSGIAAFTGDYNALVTVSPYVPNRDPNATSAFRWATRPTDYAGLSTFGAWTDSRDVIFPTSTYGVPTMTDVLGWQTYAPPGTGASCINAGARNDNVYLSEIKPGVIAGSPALSRQLVNSSGQPIERAFPVYVENPNSTEKFFRLTFNGSPLVAGSFTQGTEITGGALTQVDVDILPYSSVTTTVFLYCSGCASSNAFAPFSVSVQEINALNGTPTGSNTTAVLFNADPTAPFVTNPNLADAEIHDVTVSNPLYSNPLYSNPLYSNPLYSNPLYSNPMYSNPLYSNPLYSNIAPVDAPPVGDFVWTVQDVGNNTSAYSALTNVATSTLGGQYTYEVIVARSYNYPTANGCDIQPIPVDQVISIIPNPLYSNPLYSNPLYSNPLYSNPLYSNATFAAAPPPPGPSSAATTLMAAKTTPPTSDDGTTKMPRLPDVVYVVLRVYRTNGSTTPLSTTEQQAILSAASVTVYPQAANTGQETPQGTSNKAFSTTTLTANPAASVYGQTVTFTATVAAQAPATGTPTGTVAFLEGSTVLQLVPLQGGVATFSSSTFAPGTHTITAVYGGDLSFNSSTSADVSITVSKASTTTALTSSPNPSAAGWPVTFTATVSVNPPGSGTPDGTVTFYDGGNPIGSAPLCTSVPCAGQAVFVTSALTAGTHTITATYSGNAFFNGSTSPPLTQTVTNISSPNLTSGTLTACGYAPIPDAPTLSSTADPSGVAAGYTVRVSYVYADHESGASGESFLAVASGNLLVVSSPGAVAGAIGWNVYVGNGAADILQNAAPTAFGTSWTQPASLNTQGQLPSEPVAGSPPTTQGCIQLNGNAAAYGNTILESGAGVLQLTQEAFSQASSAFFNVLQPVKEGFTTTFTFQVKNPRHAGSGTYPADGIAFVVQNADAGVGALGGAGGSIGYGPSSAPGVTPISGSVDNSLVVEFDTFNNGTAIGDPNGNHVAVQACGPGKQSSPAHTTNNDFGWPNCLIGSVVTPSVTLADGNIHTVTITYTAPPPASPSGQLVVSIDNVQIISMTLNIEGRMILGGPSNNSAYVGFTSGTGALEEELNVLSWTFGPPPPPLQ